MFSKGKTRKDTTLNKTQLARQQSSYLTSAVALAISSVVYIFLIGFVNWVKPGLIPFSFWELWDTRGTLVDWLRAGLPLFIWGGGITLIASLLTRNSRDENRNAESLFAGDVAKSFAAGLLEEVVYRWLLFYVSFASVALVNWLFFGFAGLGIAQWFQIHLLGPLANWATLGYLSALVNNPTNWLLGAALLASNAAFRDGHKYQGWFGLLNSWFGGMFFFWLVFTYGLWAAIVVHATYDIIVFAVRYGDRVLERAAGHR